MAGYTTSFCLTFLLDMVFLSNITLIWLKQCNKWSFQARINPGVFQLIICYESLFNNFCWNASALSMMYDMSLFYEIKDKTAYIVGRLISYWCTGRPNPGVKFQISRGTVSVYCLCRLCVYRDERRDKTQHFFSSVLWVSQGYNYHF